jgi:hypothetical protein
VDRTKVLQCCCHCSNRPKKLILPGQINADPSCGDCPQGCSS